ncbi:MAG: ATP-dependent protease ATPase subunit HslU, partial [Ktedonobacterales bacterium]
MMDLTPQQVVRELDRYIVGQNDAKRVVAIAMRNRYRRLALPEDIQAEITPKNILMIGPTGVGKTEIARRLAKLADAPFVKVEATKFTQVGYVGRDVESIVRDLMDVAVSMVHDERVTAVREQAATKAEERILDILTEKAVAEEQPVVRAPARASSRSKNGSVTTMLTPMPLAATSAAAPSAAAVPARRRKQQARKQMAERLARKELEEQIIEIELEPEDAFSSVFEFVAGIAPDDVGDNFQEFLSTMPGNRRRSRQVPVKEARRLLTQEEANKLVDFDAVVEQATKRVEQSGVIFLDEIDKIVGSKVDMGPDVSGEGVQRDLLPIVEGATVQTRYGSVKTDHMLFIAAGAFHTSKPTDLIPELQGRFPIRVELEPLGAEDLRRILVEPENSLTKQYAALLETEGVTVTFTA